MAFSFFNTLGREKQPFTPLLEKKTGFYGCGPTVYNYAHIGNLRAYVHHDILVRALRRAGFDVNHVMNITDVGHLSDDADSGDDKMLKSAEERGKSVLEIADFYTKAFFNDTDSMNITRPNVICKATEHIKEMIALIGKIEKNGFTYFSGGNLYFDISKFPAYGELAMLKPDDQKGRGQTEFARIEQDENKRNACDFVLWFTKSKFENQALVWDSPWGRGYPGWHIECSAMSMKYLGDQFDIHAGGIDHIQIHHTNEIAQSEAAAGKKPWVRYWLHNEFLVMNSRGGADEKMSKSSGSFITLQSLVNEGFDPLDYRYFLLGGHYRSQLQFSFESLKGAKNSRKSLTDKIRDLAEKTGFLSADPRPAIPCDMTAVKKQEFFGHSVYKYIENFDKAIEDDLNTPRALAELWGLLKDGPAAIGTLMAVFDMDKVLGLRFEEILKESDAGNHANPAKSGEFTREIEELIAKRAEAKKAKDFKAADNIRQDLKDRGIILEDTANGTVWRIQ